jgi:hypothetical protein
MNDAAERLAARMDALAAALRDAGVDPTRASRLLGTAAAATLDAVALELMLERRSTARGTAPPARLSLRPARRRPAVPLAA